jgi:hypothetical protein
MRHILAFGLLTTAVIVGGGACCFLAVALKRTIQIAYYDWKIGRALTKPTRSPIRIVK